MSYKKEANLVSFKVLLTPENKIITEFSMLPMNKVDELFQADERDIIKSILRNGELKLKDVHAYLQRELNSLS